MVKGKRKVKRKIRFKQSAKLVHKNDATRVAKPDTTGIRRMKAQMPRTVAPVFKIKIKRKND